MQNFINRYVVWILLAIGLHVLLLMTWPSIQQPVQLRLKSGYQTVSLKFSASKVSQATERDQAQSGRADAVQTLPLPNIKTGTLAGPSSPVIDMVSSQITPLIAQKKQSSEHVQAKPLDAKKRVTKVVPAKPVVNEGHGEVSKQLTSVPPETSISPIMVAKDVISEPDNELSSLSEMQPQGVLAIAQPLSANNPKYPRRAIIRNQQGRVKVSFLVDKDGYVENIELVESSGYALLDESVLRFAEQEQFLPATQDGNPIASTQSFLFRFVLE